MCVCVKLILKEKKRGKRGKAGSEYVYIYIYIYIYIKGKKETTSHYGRSGEEMFTSLSEAAL